MPMAATPRSEAWRSTLRMLSTLPNLGTKTQARTHMTRSSARRPSVGLRLMRSQVPTERPCRTGAEGDGAIDPSVLGALEVLMRPFRAANVAARRWPCRAGPDPGP